MCAVVEVLIVVGVRYRRRCSSSPSSSLHAPSSSSRRRRCRHCRRRAADPSRSPPHQVEAVPRSCLYDLLSLPCIPCNVTVVNPREVVAMVYLGNVTNVIETPGCVYSPCCCKEERRVTSAVITIDMPNSKIVDANGSPVMVSAVLNYQITDPIKVQKGGGGAWPWPAQPWSSLTHPTRQCSTCKTTGTTSRLTCR